MVFLNVLKRQSLKHRAIIVGRMESHHTDGVCVRCHIVSLIDFEKIFEY